MQKRRLLLTALLIALSFSLAGCSRYPQDRLFPDEKGKTGFGLDEPPQEQELQAGLGQPVLPEGILGAETQQNANQSPLSAQQQAELTQALQLTPEQQAKMKRGEQVVLTPEQNQIYQQMQQGTQPPNQAMEGAQTMPQPPTSKEPTEEIDFSPEESYTATIETGAGAIEVELYGDAAPQTVKNFIQKAQTGFYRGLTFHRVESWVIQGGDPKGDGTGGGTMPTELSDKPFVKGSLGVARGGDMNISNDAQFFICTTDCDWLNDKYTNFGMVTSGMDVAEAIEKGETIKDIIVKHGS